ncbi:MAG: type I restriction endonuclease subunit R [Bdellovibrionota bacterium]
MEKNDFYLAEEVSVQCYDRKSHKRPDLVIYVNGIALAIIELKRSCVSIGEGIRQSLTNQKKEHIKDFFHTIQLIFSGSMSEGLKYGTIETKEKYFLEWREDKNAKDKLSKTIKELHTDNKLQNAIISLCHKERFLSFIHDFVVFDAGAKKVARHNQYFANIAARAKIKAKEGGIIWNTQGSGKSLIMVWLAKWIIENVEDSRVVVITDRKELDEQIQNVFYETGENATRAKSVDDLRDLLNKKEANIICSLIHKYGYNSDAKISDIDEYIKELSKSLPKGFKAKGNIIAFIDECHRTNSGKLHQAVKTIMPDAILIGFTGTPLLKKEKKTSLEIFGPYIHTYKFDEGVADGVVLDLRYEARDIDQDLSSKEKVDLWFENKTRGLTEQAQMRLKQSWTSMNKLYSARQRLEKIASDIILDMTITPRLKNERGTALLVAGSIYEACKYWEIFNSKNFSKCAVVTSYEPTDESVRTATSDLDRESEEEYKKAIYERMLGGQTCADYEREARRKFINEPASMKLLIVVDKLLTGFDAPSATYIYIDKSMRDHDLFQAICRVNRPDGEDKDYGYIVDYMDLFRNLQSTFNDYTGEAFEDYDKEDVEGLLKNRYDEAKAEMESAREAIKDLLENVGDKPKDEDHIRYFVGDSGISESEEFIKKRETLYSLVSSYTRSFCNCCDKLVSNYDYTEKEIDKIRREIGVYNNIKKMVRMSSCDYIDLKLYEPDMRYLLDTYIKAEEAKIINNLNNMSLVEIFADNNTNVPIDVYNELPGDHNARSEIIENNIKYEIVKKMPHNLIYYQKLSDILESVIEQRKKGALDYKEYLNQIVELTKAILHPEESGRYPDSIKSSGAKRAFYDFFEEDEKLALSIDKAIYDSYETNWKGNLQKQRKIQGAIFNSLEQSDYDETKAKKLVEEIFEIAKRQEEYDI